MKDFTALIIIIVLLAGLSLLTSCSVAVTDYRYYDTETGKIITDETEMVEGYVRAIPIRKVLHRGLGKSTLEPKKIQTERKPWFELPTLPEIKIRQD